MASFHAEIREADSPYFEGELVSLRFPTIDGDYGVMAGHRNMIAPVVPGVLHIETASGEKKIASVGTGFIKIENNRVILLIDSLENIGLLHACCTLFFGTIYGIVLKTDDGSEYGMRHLENIWRDQIAWSSGIKTVESHGNTLKYAQYESLMGKTIKEVTYITDT